MRWTFLPGIKGNWIMMLSQSENLDQVIYSFCTMHFIYINPRPLEYQGSQTKSAHVQNTLTKHDRSAKASRARVRCAFVLGGTAASRFFIMSDDRTMIYFAMRPPILPSTLARSFFPLMLIPSSPSWMRNGLFHFPSRRAS